MLKKPIDPHKHETPQERADRHAKVAQRVRTRFEQATVIGRYPARFDYTAWLAMHVEAENATIFHPKGPR